MGLQSACAYMAMGWLPVILDDFGMSAAQAGFVSSVSIGLQMVTALLVPPYAARQRDQRLVVAAMLLTAVVGITGLIFGPAVLAWPAAIVLGLGLGGCFGVSMTLIVLRAPDGQTAAELSGMVQSVGYVIASTGPFMLGLLHDLSGGWRVPGLFFVAVAFLALLPGLGAARARLVGVRS